VLFKHFIHLIERNHPSEKKITSKKYLDLGEEEKIREKNKNLYLYCALENIHSSEKKQT